jgi:hypothetical protein
MRKGLYWFGTEYGGSCDFEWVLYEKDTKYNWFYDLPEVEDEWVLPKESFKKQAERFDWLKEDHYLALPKEFLNVA